MSISKENLKEEDKQSARENLDDFVSELFSYQLNSREFNSAVTEIHRIGISASKKAAAFLEKIGLKTLNNKTYEKQKETQEIITQLETISANMSPAEVKKKYEKKGIFGFLFKKEMTLEDYLKEITDFQETYTQMIESLNANSMALKKELYYAGTYDHDLLEINYGITLYLYKIEYLKNKLANRASHMKNGEQLKAIINEELIPALLTKEKDLLTQQAINLQAEVALNIQSKVLNKMLVLMDSGLTTTSSALKLAKIVENFIRNQILMQETTKEVVKNNTNLLEKFSEIDKMFANNPLNKEVNQLKKQAEDTINETNNASLITENNNNMNITVEQNNIKSVSEIDIEGFEENIEVVDNKVILMPQNDGFEISNNKFDNLSEKLFEQSNLENEKVKKYKP